MEQPRGFNPSPQIELIQESGHESSKSEHGDLRRMSGCVKGRVHPINAEQTHFYDLLHRLAMEYESQLRLARAGVVHTSVAQSNDHEPLQDSHPELKVQPKSDEIMDMDAKIKTLVKKWESDEVRSGSAGSAVQDTPPRGDPSIQRSHSGNLSEITNGSRTKRRSRDKGYTAVFELLQPWTEPLDLKMCSQRTSSRTRSLVAAIASTEDQVVTEEASCARCRPFVAHPSSTRRLFWDLTGMLLLVYDILVIPFMAAFQPEEGPVMIVLTWGTCIFWTLDMASTFLTGYVKTKENVIVLDPYKIALRYLKAWFWLDLLIVSLDWILVVAEGSTQGSMVRFGRSLRTLRFIRTLRLLRVVKLKKLIQVLQDEISSEGAAICFGVCQVVFWLLVSNHIVGCCWYAVGSIEMDGNDKSWLAGQQVEKRSVLYLYATSLHWSLAQFTPAPNEIFPQNVHERIFAVVVLVFAMVAFSSFVSSLTTAMMQLKHLISSETHNFWILRRYLRDWKVRPAVRVRILRYLEYAFQKHQQKVQEKDVQLLSLLSQPLQEELRQETLRMHLFGHALFATCRHQVRVFSKALSLGSFARADKFFECGEQATHMLFVANGMMEYYLGELAHHDEIGSHLSQGMDHASLPRPTEYRTDAIPDHVLIGQWVCEPVLWTSWTHLGDLFAVTECQTVAIDALKFAVTVRMNLPLWHYMMHYALKFVSQVNSYPYERLTDLMHTLLLPSTLTGTFANLPHEWLLARDDERSSIMKIRDYFKTLVGLRKTQSSRSGQLRLSKSDSTNSLDF